MSRDSKVDSGGYGVFPCLGGRYKRPFDLLVLLVSHLVLLPVFLSLWILIPLAIWLEDRGPIFYTQRRVGLGAR